MNIQELKNAITEAIEFGDQQRNISRSLYSIDAIRALEALRDSFGDENGNDEIDLATVIAQVGYIFTHHPVTPGSATEATWTHLLENVLPPDLDVTVKNKAQWVTEIQETQRSATTTETIVKLQGNTNISIKAVRPTIERHTIQDLANAVQAALAGYYKQKYFGKINPAIKALEVQHRNWMGKVLTGKAIDKDDYVAAIVKIFAVDHPVQAGTMRNNASYDVWLKLLPQLGLNLDAATTPKVAHSRLLKTFSKTATPTDCNFVNIQSAVNNSGLDASAMPSQGATKAMDSTPSLSIWFKNWGRSRNWDWPSFFKPSTPVSAPATAIHKEPVVAVTLQQINQQLGLNVDLDIWQENTVFSTVLAAVGTAEKLNINAITLHLAAGKLLDSYLHWQDNTHADTFWSAMIDGLKNTTTAFIRNSEAFRVALIAHWDVEDSVQCLAHVKGWVINNDRVLAAGIAEVLIQKWQDTPNTFATQNEAFQLVLIQQWPANQQAALLKHVATWDNLTATNQQALITRCAATKETFTAQSEASQVVLIQGCPTVHATLLGYVKDQPSDAIKTALIQSWPADNTGLMDKLNAWETIPDTVYPLLLPRFAATPDAFKLKRDDFKIALIEQCPDAQKDTLIKHTKTWKAPLAGVAEALLTRLQDKATAFIYHGADFQAALVNGCSVSTQHILLKNIEQWKRPLDVNVYVALTADPSFKAYFTDEKLDGEHKMAYIQQWPKKQFAFLKTRLDAWYPAAVETADTAVHPIPTEVFKALIGRFKDQANVFSAQDVAFKVELVRHWPLNDLDSLVKHVHAWYSRDAIPENIQAALTTKLEAQSPAAIAVLFKAIAAAENAALTPVQQFLVDLFDAQKFLTNMKLTTYDARRLEKAVKKSSAVFSDFDKITQTDRSAAFDDFNTETQELSKPLLAKIRDCLNNRQSPTPTSPFLTAMQSSGQSSFGTNKDIRLADVITALKQRL